MMPANPTSVLKSRLVVLAAVAALVFLPAMPAGAVPKAFRDYTRVFHDGFDDTDFSDNWYDFRTPGRAYGGGSGIYASNAVTELNNNLRIEAYTAPNSNGVSTNYVGSVRSRQSFLYGYFEANILFETASGIHQAFWMMPANTDIGAQPANAALNGAEIDIVEHRVVDSEGADISDSVFIADHYGGYGAGEVSRSRLVGDAIDDSRFNKYGVFWTPDMYKFYINDRYVGFTIHDNAQDTAISNVAQYLLFSNNIGVSWSGPVTDDYGDLGSQGASGSRMVVASVSVYQDNASASAVAIPEPTTLACFGLAMLAGLRRTRRTA